MSHHNHSGNSGERELAVDPHDLGHILPYSTYIKTFVWLVILTVVTVGAAALELAKYSAMIAMIVAMAIASVKAFLVAANFMHLKYENPVTWLYAIFPLVLLAILIGLIFLDNPFRTAITFAPVAELPPLVVD